jgi:hypothetical protein
MSCRVMARLQPSSDPDAGEAEQVSRHCMPGLMIGDLAAGLTGVDRASPAPIGAIQLADMHHEEGIGTDISTELARDRKGVLVIRRSPLISPRRLELQ